MSTPLYLLRCKQVNLSIQELDTISMGMAIDMLTEQTNDEYDYPIQAEQEDFDMF